jgi:hypothetical protein
MRKVGLEEIKEFNQSHKAQRCWPSMTQRSGGIAGKENGCGGLHADTKRNGIVQPQPELSS